MQHLEAPPSTAQPSPWMSIREAADYLRMSESWLKKAVAENTAPHVHIGRRALLHRDHLDLWLLDTKPGIRT